MDGELCRSLRRRTVEAFFAGLATNARSVTGYHDHVSADLTAWVREGSGDDCESVRTDREREMEQQRAGQWGGAVATPAIDFESVGGIDSERLARSLQLAGERVGSGRYRVTGGAQDHWVDLYTTSHPRCDCGDHLWREQLCKHILAALLREGNDRVVTALGRLFAELRDLRKAA